MQPETDFVSPPPFPNAQLPDAAALQALRDIEQGMQRSESPLPESPVSDFPAPMMTVMYSPHRITPAAAREAVAAALAQASQELPRGAKTERAADTLRPVFIPRWFLSGEISGKWSANGVATESWEIDCPACFGSGKTGVGTQQHQCESCWGSGKQKKSHKNKSPERGDASVSLLDSLDNNASGVELTLTPLHEAEPLLLPDEERLRLRCLRPASIYSSTALDRLKNRLAATMEEQAKVKLAQYSRIDDFMFEPETVRSHSAVAAWLYPAYLGTFKLPAARGYVVCDALSGKVSWALGAVPVATSATSSTLFLRLAGGLALAAAVGAAVWYFR